MKHLCKQLIEAVLYLEENGMSQREYSTLHHNSLKGRENTFAKTYGYFNIERNLRKKNTDFAQRCIFVVKEHQRIGGKNFGTLMQAALGKWPLAVVQTKL